MAVWPRACLVAAEVRRDVSWWGCTAVAFSGFHMRGSKVLDRTRSLSSTLSEGFPSPPFIDGCCGCCRGKGTLLQGGSGWTLKLGRARTLRQACEEQPGKALLAHPKLLARLV